MATGKPRSDEGAGNADEEGGDDAIFAEINITPLTDVFLVMVIIFMISALAATVEAQEEKRQAVVVQEKIEQEKKSGLKVNLPSGQSQEIDMSKASLIVIIPVNGPVAVNGVQVETEDELTNLFRRSFLSDKQTQVVIQADKGVQHGRVVSLMERAKAAGLTKLAIGTTGGGG
jgi:biopolymer transport protein ExbD